LRAVILAGGKGTRLAPYTTVFPKPLMPVGDMPILELLIRQLEHAGIDRVTLAVGHLSSLLMAYFQDGAQLGLPIDYSVEREPLGTAGPLGLVEGLDETFLVMNGDLLTDLDFQAMIDAHRRRGVVATIGIYERLVTIDLGVVETTHDNLITGYIEKPTNRFLVSMGVYVLEPAVLSLIPRLVPFDLPDLVRRLLTGGEAVAGFLHPGYWLDIGRPDDYQRAQEDAVEIQRMLLADRSDG
jgi:NDP-mannose synthase